MQSNDLCRLGNETTDVKRSARRSLLDTYSGYQCPSHHSIRLRYLCFGIDSGTKKSIGGLTVSSNTIRISGVVAGILAGTIVALLFRGPLRSYSSQVTKTVAQSKSNVISVEADEDELESRSAPPDPGMRFELKRMVAEAKKEAAWLKEFELTERSGRNVKSEDLKGEPYIACFFFSTCPGTCTRQSNQMQLLQSKFKTKPIKLVSITVDPEIDTPAVLAEYAEKFQANKDKWLFLTGPMDYIIRVGTEKFFLGGIEKRGHPDRFCLVNAQGDLVGSYEWLYQKERELLIAHTNELLQAN